MNTLKKLKDLFEELYKLEDDLVNSQGLPLQVARLFIAICNLGTKGISTSDANLYLRYNSATLSRNMNTLSARPKRSGTGLGLIDTYENPDDRREKLIKLTTKGIKTRDRMIKIFD
tara:strand:+ start:377 stop:724 length:348 start_codon:yes stop_codon:yes gene_type:complete